MPRNRWIIPVSPQGRIEISISGDKYCRIAFFDTGDIDHDDGATLTRDELSDFIPALVDARSALDELQKVEVQLVKETAWCCDPGNQSRPRPGCDCPCCLQETTER